MRQRVLVPIGFLLSRRMARPWPLARWLSLGPRKVNAPSGVAPDYVFRPTSRWLSAVVMWTVAMGRRQTQPTEATLSSSPLRTPERPAPAIGDGTEAGPRAIQSFGLQRRPAPPARAPLQLDLPRLRLNAPLALRLSSGDVLSLSKGQALSRMLTVRPITNREPAAQRPTSTRPAPRAADSDLKPWSEPTAIQQDRRRQGRAPGITGKPLSAEALVSGPASPQRPESRRTFGSLTQSPRTWPGHPLAQHAPGAQEPAGGWRAWIPLALHLPVRATPPQHGLVHRTPGVMVSEEGRARDHAANPGRFRPTVAREVALLVKEVTRVVEERVRPAPEPPPRQAQPLPPPAPQLDPAEVFRLAQREYRERAFRMGL